MDSRGREFLTGLLETPTPAGYEGPGQRRWLEYLDGVADETWTDAYGNAIAVSRGEPDAPEVVLTGHGDEVGFIVRTIDDDGFVRPGRIGGVDATVSRGQHVRIHTEDGPVDGVVGQHAIHLREDDEEADVSELWIDVGADDGEAARDRLEVGDPITFASTYTWLADGRLAGRGLDDRVGTWAAAEGFRLAAEADPAATVYAVSTVQEELGGRGARMVGFDLEPDAVVAVDVGHALDYPGAPTEKGSDVELGGGPVIARGSTNHPTLSRALRSAAADADVPIQLEAAGTGTSTDADAFFTARGGIPSQLVSVPSRYMHTPVETVDVADLTDVATVLGAFAERAEEYAPFAVEL